MTPKVKNVQVISPLTTDSLIVQWDQAGDGVTGYNVYRALSKEGDFLQINSVPVTGTVYSDATAKQQSRTIYYYSITALVGIDEGFKSEPASVVLIAKDDNRETLSRLGNKVEMSHRRILKRIVYQDGLLLRRSGELVDMYIRRTAGIKCTACFAPAYNQPANPDCATCFGTTYQGGYDKYDGVLISMGSIETKMELNEGGVRIFSNPPAWTGTFPLINNGDILVRRYNNKRYAIEQRDEKVSQGILTRQTFNIAEMLPTEMQALFALK